ncbi:translation initiation protein Sua5 [Phyllosticta citrichinensis]|uniref:Threonylcarbamoyl-AMP synthase n=1 Tax=Phyllosticta citrichinensis TaxID=1130410 RepID=A0ABR1XPP7_9PEZI
MPNPPNVFCHSTITIYRSLRPLCSLLHPRAPAAPAILRRHAMTPPPTQSQDQPSATMSKPRETTILPVDASKLGTITLSRAKPDALLDDWHVEWADSGSSVANLRHAASELRKGTHPVAFPTETVYGLGADATRSSAVRGIYAAKQRPADNPLIVHVSSLDQLRSLLRAPNDSSSVDPIPAIYHSLIQRFWPGPLTMIMPLPSPSPLAPEVTAQLSTFGARMPRSLIALLLIHLADRPIAAPSANASTKPSPTAAEHVAYDLNGRITTILDGGPCDVGVESTVVDGISGDTPVILRPGGVSIDELRTCPGWERVGVAYKDKAEMGSESESKSGAVEKEARVAPRAPGMKYRHYSPRARVMLFEAGAGVPGHDIVQEQRRIGLIRTKRWPRGCGFNVQPAAAGAPNGAVEPTEEEGQQQQDAALPQTTLANGTTAHTHRGFSNLLDTFTVRPVPVPHLLVPASSPPSKQPSDRELWEVNLGSDTRAIARGLFSALRELDRKDVDIILVEGIDEREGDVAAAVMNRLRKAAEVEVKGSQQLS